MLKDLWRVLTGTLSTDMLMQARHMAYMSDMRAETQTRRANEAVRLYNEGEIARKQSSDALGNAVIKQMLGDK